jgi:hypothetical protein
MKTMICIALAAALLIYGASASGEEASPRAGQAATRGEALNWGALPRSRHK